MYYAMNLLQDNFDNRRIENLLLQFVFVVGWKRVNQTIWWWAFYLRLLLGLIVITF